MRLVGNKGSLWQTNLQLADLIYNTWFILQH
jgi:hypothetical protein